MNFAHIHQIINHIPLIGIPIGLVLLAFGLQKRSALVQRFSLILTLATGIVAAVAYCIQKDEKKSRIANFGVLGIAGLAVISLAYTANLGGKIRHT